MTEMKCQVWKSSETPQTYRRAGREKGMLVATSGILNCQGDLDRADTNKRGDQSVNERVRKLSAGSRHSKVSMLRVQYQQIRESAIC